MLKLQNVTKLSHSASTFRGRQSRLVEKSTIALIADSSKRQQLTSEHDDRCDAEENREDTEAETINNRRQKHPVTCRILHSVALLRLRFLHHNVPMSNDMPGMGVMTQTRLCSERKNSEILRGSLSASKQK